MNNIIIDVATKDAKRVYNRIKKLRSTISIEEPAMYCMDNSYSQIKLTSTHTVDELELWCWKTKGIDYVGVVADD